MADDYEYTGSTIHPAIAERLHRLDVEVREVEGKCDRRHQEYNRTANETRNRCEQHGRRLVAIAGEDGTNGKLAALAKEMIEVHKRLDSQKKLIMAVIFAALGTTGIATAITQVLIHAAGK